MRIPREQMFMEVAEIYSRRSSCFRLNVGCTITIDNRPVSIGYNGPPSGEPHCLGNECPLTPSGGCSRSLHAEANALNWYKADDRPMTIYVTHSPCPTCCELILARNVEAVYYRIEYRIIDGIKRLIEKGVRVYQLSPSGYKINKATNEVEVLI